MQAMLGFSEPESDPRIREELNDGERLIWAGRPIPSRFARRGWPQFLMGIPFTAFALFWTGLVAVMMFGASANGGSSGASQPPPSGSVVLGILPLFFLLWGLMFVGVGLFTLGAPYRLYRRARHVLYAVTDQRCIVWQPAMFRGESVRSFAPSTVLNLERKSDAQGRGDLVFEPPTDFHQRAMRRAYGIGPIDGFLAIESVREVERLVRETMALAAAS